MSYQPGGVVRAIPVLGALAIGAQRLLPLLQLIYHAWSRTAGSFQIVVDIADLLARPQPEVDEGENKDHLLRPGMSVEPTVYTK